jgi:amidophosphoribosyltransferase
MRGAETLSAGIEIQKPGEACGVVMVRLRPDAHVEPHAHFIAVEAINQLSNRGDAATGLAVRCIPDGNGEETLIKVGGPGDASHALGGSRVLGLDSRLAMAHGRYATSNMSNEQDPMSTVQPMERMSRLGPVVQGHNGDISNAEELAELFGVNPDDIASDSDLALLLLTMAIDQGMDEVEAIAHVSHLMVGAYSMTTMVGDRQFAWRDPWGFRPLYVGELPDGVGWVVASEQPAFEVGTIGATELSEVPRGHAVELTDEGLVVHELFSAEEIEQIPPSFCAFEFVYFSRPDSRHMGRSVEDSREEAGELLAEQSGITGEDIDIVVGSPESGMSAARGFAFASHVRQKMGLIRNPKSKRAFMAAAARADGVLSKLNPNKPVVAGKRVGVVDDSVVRGDTSATVNEQLKAAGVKEIVQLVASMPYIATCEFGMDTKNPEDLVARGRTIEEVAKIIGADSLHFLTRENFERALGPDVVGRVCMKCMTGEDPTVTPVQIGIRQDYLEKTLANQ